MLTRRGMLCGAAGSRPAAAGGGARLAQCATSLAARAQQGGRARLQGGAEARQIREGGRGRIHDAQLPAPPRRHVASRRQCGRTGFSRRRRLSARRVSGPRRHRGGDHRRGRHGRLPVQARGHPQGQLVRHRADRQDHRRLRGRHLQADRRQDFGSLVHGRRAGAAAPDRRDAAHRARTASASCRRSPAKARTPTP